VFLTTPASPTPAVPTPAVTSADLLPVFFDFDSYALRSDLMTAMRMPVPKGTK
jgi:hypothetical protein